jgi:hypothetical protein
LLIGYGILDGHHLPVSSQGKSFHLLLGISDAIPGDRLPASSQVKNVNVLLVRGDGIYGSSPPYIFSRENCEPVIGKR